MLGSTVGTTSYFQGNVGIGSTTPQAALDVAGNIKVGYNSACSATTAGSIRFNDRVRGLQRHIVDSTWRGNSDHLYGPLVDILLACERQQRRLHRRRHLLLC